MVDFETSKKQIEELVDKFKNKENEVKKVNFDEENTKIEFINEFFRILGWDVDNKAGDPDYRKEVQFEHNVRINGKTKAVDYCFKLNGKKKFFVEAKKPSVNIKHNKKTAHQIKRYTWNAGLPIGILTDFEELAIYEPKVTPKEHHDASIDRMEYYEYTDYVDKWDEIYNLFSKDAVINGSLDKIENSPTKKETVTSEFLKTISEWRLELAKNIANRNKDLSLSPEELNFAVQLIIDRIIFLRIAEDRGIERYGQLKKIIELANDKKDEYPVYEAFIELCKKADEKYNSGLFHFKEEKDISLSADNLTPKLKIDDGKLKKIIRGLYYPDSPYEFSMISTEILGNIYEQFLGKVIRLTPTGMAKVEYKPEVKKAGGVYYTPQYIVDYIVENTVGELLKSKTPNKVSELRIIDPACGSGSFLLGAYQKLLDWHLDYYSKLDKKPKDVIYKVGENEYKLTIQEKKRILLNNIYGVDIDAQAVEVTKLSLLLKVLEDENKDELESQQKLIQERALPYLGDNIRCGNSLIGTNIMDSMDLSSEDLHNINPFDWEDEFPYVFKQGGFDTVIGNPPYVFGGNPGIDKLEKNYFKDQYESGTGKINLFTLFMEKGVKLLSESGLLSFIIPNTLLRVTSYKKIRKYLVENITIKEIVDLQPGVFKGVTTSPIIFTLNNKSSRLNNDVIIKKDLTDNIFNQVKQKDFTKHGYIYNIFCKESERLIINSLNEDSIKLGELCKYLRFGVVISKNKDEIVANEKIDNNYKPYLEGKEIGRYSIDYKGQYLKYIPRLIHRPRTADLFESEKLMIQRITGGDKPLKATYDNGYYYNKESIINLVLESPDFNIKYILALLNSNLMNWYYNKEFSNESKLTVNLSKEYLSEIPVKNISLEEQQQFIELTDKMLELNKNLADCKIPKDEKILKLQISKTDDKINQLVYELYNLTDEKIAIIESEADEDI